ncbi:hypothetical protein ACO0LL_29595 [Undibacterium sp. TC4M20W]|uniref:hypothetical protein n=1 Tax=Undibacterium sp. TC4M20W TaxID=3413052 RepID=UPI003BF321C9
MSYSLQVYTPTPVALRLQTLLSKAEEWRGDVPNPERGGKPVLMVTLADKLADRYLYPGTELYSFTAPELSDSGAFFYYSLDPDLALHSPVPLYTFCMTEIHRSAEDAFQVSCLSMMMVVATEFKADYITDASDIWSMNSEGRLSLDRLK